MSYIDGSTPPTLGGMCQSDHVSQIPSPSHQLSSPHMINRHNIQHHTLHIGVFHPSSILLTQKMTVKDHIIEITQPAQIDNLQRPPSPLLHYQNAKIQQALLNSINDKSK